MAQRRRGRVGFIERQGVAEPKRRADHPANLFLGGAPMARDREFDARGGVFADLDAEAGEHAQRGAAQAPIAWAVRKFWT